MATVETHKTHIHTHTKNLPKKKKKVLCHILTSALVSWTEERRERREVVWITQSHYHNTIAQLSVKDTGKTREEKREREENEKTQSETEREGGP